MPADLPTLDEVVKEFLAESAECLDIVEGELVGLESGRNLDQSLASIFRAVHNLKGNSAALGFSAMESLAHAGEAILGQLRATKQAPDAATINGLLKMVDRLRELLAGIAAGDGEPSSCCQPLLAGLQSFLQQTPPVTTPAGARQEPTSEKMLREAENAYRRKVRVDVELLDQMMELSGELILARNRILQFQNARIDIATQMAGQRLRSLSTELQAGVMKARLLPIGSVWKNVPRLVRDMAEQCGKHVSVDFQGSETELDRTIAETVRDPLIHIVRNAIDHGIECPEQRVQAGKPQCGHLHLRAYPLGGRVHIEIADDGVGIDPERVRATAIQHGVITPERAAEMDAEALQNLVFAPGFSTTPTATNFSGRGVGLDVVKSNIESINGAVRLHSVKGQGTTLHLEVPLTLTVIPALLVGSGGERFAIPQANVVELACVPKGQIECAGQSAVLQVRDRLLPILYLNRELALGGRDASCNCNIVVLEAVQKRVAVVVDSIHEIEEMVVRRLGTAISLPQCFAGAAILSDGRVRLILDVPGLMRATSMASATPPAKVAPAGASVTAFSKGMSFCTFYLGPLWCGITTSEVQGVVRTPPLTPVPLSSLAGLINLRGQVVPVIHLHHRLGVPESCAAALGTMVVVRSQAGVFGLLADEVGDLMEPPHETFEPAAVLPMLQPGELFAGVYKLSRLLHVVRPEAAVSIASLPKHNRVTPVRGNL